MSLTPKQERFIQNIVSGMSQRQAYKEAFNPPNTSDEAIDVDACRLFNTPKITLRYKELIKQLEDEAILTAKQRMKWLSDVVNDIQREDVYIKTDNGTGEVIDTKIGSKNADLNTKMKAIDILNKMDGEYVTKIEGNVSIEKLEDLL